MLDYFTHDYPIDSQCGFNLNQQVAESFVEALQ